MTADPDQDDSSALSRTLWLLMSDLVLDQGRRRELSEALSTDELEALRPILERIGAPG